MGSGFRFGPGEQFFEWWCESSDLLLYILFNEEKMELQIMYKRGHQRSLIFSLHSFPWIHPHQRSLIFCLHSFPRIHPHQHFAYIFHNQSLWFDQTSLALPLPEPFFHAPSSFRHQEQRCPPAPAVSRCPKAHL